jgi:hypothetical protein
LGEAGDEVVNIHWRVNYGVWLEADFQYVQAKGHYKPLKQYPALIETDEQFCTHFFLMANQSLKV